MGDKDHVKDVEVLKAATRLAAVALATGVIDFFEESINNDRRSEYRKIIEKARTSTTTVSTRNNLDLYEYVNIVHNILKECSCDDSVNTCLSSSKSSTCILL